MRVVRSIGSRAKAEASRRRRRRYGPPSKGCPIAPDEPSFIPGRDRVGPPNVRDQLESIYRRTSGMIEANSGNPDKSEWRPLGEI
jgi:hypothetical protein